MAGFSQRRSAAQAIRRYVQQATLASDVQGIRTTLFQKLQPGDLLRGAANSQSAFFQSYHGQPHCSENLAGKLLEQQRPSHGRHIAATRALSTTIQDASAGNRELPEWRSLKPALVFSQSSRQKPWSGAGQVSTASTACKWEVTRHMSTFDPPTEGEGLSPVLVDVLEDGVSDKNSKLNDTLLQLWSTVRRVPEDSQLLMPTVMTWMAGPGNVLTRDLAYMLARRLKQRRRYKHATELTEWMVTSSGWTPTLFDYKILIDGCCRWGRIGKAEHFFHSMPAEFRTEEVLASILMYFGRKGMLTKVESRMAEARKEGIELSTRVYNVRLLACGKRKLLAKIPDVLKEMKELGIERNLQTFNILIDCYGKAGELEDMRRVFDEMQDAGFEPDGVTYNTLASNYFAARENEMAESALEDCKRGPGPSLSTYLTMMWAYSRQGAVEKMEAAFDEMKQTRLPLFRQIWMARIHGYGQAGHPDRAREVFEEMATGHHLPVTMSYNCLLSAYTVNQRMVDAEALVKEMEENGKSLDAISYQYLIKGYMSIEDFEAAVKIFLVVSDHRQNKYLRPAISVFLELVEHFAKLGNIQTLDKLMFEGGKMYNLDAQLFNLWLNAHVSAQQRQASSTSTAGELVSTEGGETKEGEEGQQGPSVLQGQVNQSVLRIMKKMKRERYKPTLRTLDLLRQLGAEEMAKGFGWGKPEMVEETTESEGVEKSEAAVGAAFGEGKTASDAEHPSEDQESSEELRLAAINAVEEGNVRQSQPA